MVNSIFDPTGVVDKSKTWEICWKDGTGEKFRVITFSENTLRSLITILDTNKRVHSVNWKEIIPND